MPLLNPSFEDSGELPGQAAHWTISSVTSLEEIAGFGAGPELAWEAFEWFPLLASLEDGAVVRAFFDAAVDSAEDFENAWGPSAYLFELPPAQLVTCAFGGRAVEDCERDWDNEPFLDDWQRVPAAPALFGNETIEGFEEWWRNDLYARTWAMVAASPASFDAGTQPAEDFENDWPTAPTL